jgi:hypothetical protein
MKEILNMEKLMLNKLSTKDFNEFVGEHLDSLSFEDIKNFPEYEISGLNENTLKVLKEFNTQGLSGATSMKYETLMSLSVGNFLVDMEVGITEKKPECNFRVFKKDLTYDFFTDTSDRDCVDYIRVKKYFTTDGEYLSNMYSDILKYLKTNSFEYISRYYDTLWNILKKYINLNY